VADLGLNFYFFWGGMEGASVQKIHAFATKLDKHSVKQRDTTAIMGGLQMSPLP